MFVPVLGTYTQFSPFTFVARRIVEIHDGFEEINGFPRVIGAVDGCHIRIRTPSSHPDAYLNRLRYHSIILPVFCFSNFYQLVSFEFGDVSLQLW